MRVALVSTYPPKHCGIAHFAQNLEASLGACASTDVTVFTPDVLGRATAEEMSSVFDVVCLQFEHGLYGQHGQEAVSLMKALTVPVVTTLHADIDRGFAIQEDVLWEVLGRSRRIVTPSANTYRRLSGSALASGRLAYIPHGVPSVPYESPGRGDEFVVLNFGYMAPHKGLDTLLEAFSIVSSQVGNARLILAGADHPDWPGEYRHRLEQAVRRLGLEDRVEFRNQQLPERELLDLIGSADVVATLYTHLGQGISGVVAYGSAVGRPVVSTAFPYAQQILANYEKLLVPSGDARAAADVLVELASSPDLRQAIGKDLWLSARRMTWPSVGREYDVVLRDAWAEQGAFSQSRPKLGRSRPSGS